MKRKSSLATKAKTTKILTSRISQTNAIMAIVPSPQFLT